MECGLSLGVPSATPQVEESDDAAAAAAEGSGSGSGDSGASADSGLTGKQGGLSAGELERQARAQEAGSLHGMDLSHDLGLASHDGLETSFTNYVRGYIGCLGLCLCVDFCVYVGGHMGCLRRGRSPSVLLVSCLLATSLCTCRRTQPLRSWPEGPGSSDTAP